VALAQPPPVTFSYSSPGEWPLSDEAVKQIVRAVGIVAITVAVYFFWPATGARADGNQPAPPGLTLLEALQSTLALHPSLRIQQQQVDLGRGLRQQASGQFDTVLDAGLSQDHTDTPLTQLERAQVEAAGITTSNETSNLTTLAAGATKQFRNGVSIAPSFQNIRTTGNLEPTGVNLSNLLFQVNVPLMRGHGRGAVAAQETAAGIEVGAGQFDLNQTISDLLAGTATSYWALLAAQRNLQVALGSEERGKIYVQNVQTLIDADRVPKAEIFQVDANLSERTVQRIEAEQAVVETRQSLALAMGVGPGRMTQIGDPSQDFPVPSTLPAVTSALIDATFQLAEKNRADLLAAEQRIDEARTLLAGSRNLTRPQLNLSFNTGYSGLEEGTGVSKFFASPFRGLQGPDAFAGVNYSVPITNNTALGQLRQSQASVEQARLRLQLVQRQVMADVVDALEGVAHAAKEVAVARQAVEAYRKALEGEREKYRLGVGSLVDVLTIEDRLTGALQSQVGAAESYAVALAQLRRATGTIVPPAAPVSKLDVTVFFTLPEAPGGAGSP
jgi:outer membrane protein TolC